VLEGAKRSDVISAAVRIDFWRHLWHTRVFGTHGNTSAVSRGEVRYAMLPWLGRIGQIAESVASGPLGTIVVIPRRRRWQGNALAYL